jgi:branched-chain amino acid aminotransferase
LSVSADQIKKEVLLLISRNSFSDANIKLIASFTQGEGNSESQFCGYFIEHQYPSVQEFADGVAVITYQAIRQNPNAKVINMSLRQTTNEMKSSIGVYEVLLVDNEGNITEGSRSNVFFIRRGQFFTPSVTDVLPGITRKYVMEAIRNLGLPISECKVSLKDAECMQTVFITGTSRKILPVNRMNLRNFRVDNPYLSAVMAEFNRIVTTTLESFR